MTRPIFYSLGLVTEDIKEDDLYITVYPIEILTNYDGNINDEEDLDITTEDIDGKTYKTKLNKSVKITAKWLPRSNPNRLTPPNVCKGERVEIYQYADTDEFYWVSMFNELALRKLEKATYVYSNKRSIEDKSLLNKAYWFTIDTINKFIRLHTDDSDKEKTTYDLEIDTAEGNMTIVDGRKNIIMLESMKDTLTIKTNKKINLITDNTVNINGKEIINSTTKTHNLKSDNTNTTISSKYNIKLDKLVITNSTAELVTTLSDLLAAIIAEQHIGNLGIPTALHPSSIAKFQGIKAKIDSFKG